MTIQLSPELEDIVQKHIATGRYHSAAEVLREALNLLDQGAESREAQLQSRDQKIDQGLASLEKGKGIDGEHFFEELRQREEQLNRSSE